MTTQGDPMTTALRLDLTIRTYKDGDKWTWTLWKGSRIVATSGSQLFTRRIDAARGAEVGTGVSGVYEALVNVHTKEGGTAKRLAFRRLDGVTVRLVDERVGGQATLGASSTTTASPSRSRLS